MEQEKSTVGAIVSAIIITAVVAGGGVYMWQKNQTPQPKQEVTTPAVTTPTKEEPTEPLSYSTTGVSATVSKKTASFDYTAEALKGMADECGSQHNTGYFDQLVSKFSGTTKTMYNFKYTGVSQDSSTFVVTLLPNKAGYTSLDQFKKDFDICAAGGGAYPKMLNSSWLLFVNACGTGFDDGSGKPIGCQEVRDVVEPTLKLNTNQQVTKTQDIVYTNLTYGYTLTFPQTWKDYTAKIRALNWGTLGTSDSVDFGFSAQDSLFNISVFTKGQWQKIKSEEGPTPTYLGEDSLYVYGYATAQDATNDIMIARMSEVPSIVKTFVIPK